MRERIERIRHTAVRFRRTDLDPSAADEAATVKAELEGQLASLSIEDTLHVARAFSYFSHLLNIAEDAQQNRRRRAHAHARSPRRPGSIAHALEHAARAASPEKLIAWFGHARVSPVLTAHPTEVQRQSILDCEREIARLVALEPQPARDRALEVEVTRLWLTAMLRMELTVDDEIVNGLAYFRLTLLEELPRVYADIEEALRARFLTPRQAVPPDLAHAAQLALESGWQHAIEDHARQRIARLSRHQVGAGESGRIS